MFDWNTYRSEFPERVWDVFSRPVGAFLDFIFGFESQKDLEDEPRLRPSKLVMIGLLIIVVALGAYKSAF